VVVDVVGVVVLVVMDVVDDVLVWEGVVLLIEPVSFGAPAVQPMTIIHKNNVHLKCVGMAKYH
jgi:hypothetical protein